MKKRLKRPLSLVLALVMALSLAVPALATEPTDITVTPQSAPMAVGETLTLTAAILPEEADPSGLVWFSLDPAIASVTQEGLVTALAVGETIIGYHKEGQTSPVGVCVITVSRDGTEQPDPPQYPLGDRLVLSSTEETIQTGQYQTRLLKAPVPSVLNGETNVTDSYTFSYSWTREGESLPGAESTLVTPAFQEDMLLTCTITATNTTDTAQVLTGRCLYRLEVLPGTMIEAVAYANLGPKTLDTLFDLEGVHSLTDQLTLGIDGSLETPAIEGLSQVIFYPDTVSGEDVGTLNAEADTVYTLDGADGKALADLVFTPVMEGTYTIGFLARGTRDYYGQLTISISGQTSPSDGVIRCTSSGFTFSGSDFAFHDDADPVVAMVFQQPAVGRLLRNFAQGNGAPAAGERYYIDSSHDGDYHISTLSYLPAPGYEGLATLPVTYCSRSGKTIPQTILVEVISKTTSDHFLDVTPSTVGIWAANSIDFAYDCGLIKGVDATLFAPNTPMTRAMLVTVLYRAAGSPPVTVTTNFTDLVVGDYYYSAVVWANVKGIVTGVTDTTFDPNSPVTRQQIATILYRYAKASGGYPVPLGSLEGFSDKAGVEPYALEPMSWAVGEGIISGTTPTTLSPLSPATRAQVAVMLHRYLV